MKVNETDGPIDQGNNNLPELSLQSADIINKNKEQRSANTIFVTLKAYFVFNLLSSQLTIAMLI